MNDTFKDRLENQPDGLQRRINASPVVVFCSNITDTRAITARLRRLGVEFKLVVMGMGCQAMRDLFHRLCEHTGWQCLPQIFVDGRFIGGYDEFFAYDFATKEAGAGKRLPAAALTFGAGGLVPFLFGATALWFTPFGWRADISRLLILYGAIILTFTGAVHWGLAMRPDAREASVLLWRRLGLSVAPALIAWVSLLQRPVTALVILIAAYFAQYAIDVAAVRAGWAPTWYLGLRSALTALATICLVASLAALTLGAATVG